MEGGSKCWDNYSRYRTFQLSVCTELNGLIYNIYARLLIEINMKSSGHKGERSEIWDFRTLVTYI